ncbi:MAG: TraR/DksA family transcriptional regulator [Candidatus Parcubacteria bacterium]|nr:TraR/DksA family transcriptional regulator [Candidatus Parcubacteria bacterium]
MKKEILEKIKNDLLARKKQIENELSGFAKEDKFIKDNYRSEFPDYGDKEDENAEEIAQYTDNLSIEFSLEKTLRDIKKALERIENGTYGKCAYCGQEIPEDRLMARPTSNACVECKEKLTSQ